MELIIKCNDKDIEELFKNRFPDMDKIRDKFWTENYIGKLKEKIDRLEMDLQNRDDEIQDLKLENDRLQQREKLYQKFINVFDCHDRSCIRCPHYCPDGLVMCKLTLVKPRHDLINDFKKKLEDL